MTMLKEVVNVVYHLLIEKMVRADWNRVQEIYSEGIKTGNATFETEVPTWKKWDSSHSLECRISARANQEIVGWATLSPVSSRSVYDGVAEVSVYIDQAYNGQGVGSKLLNKLVEISEQNGVWTLQSGIFPENIASIR
ncbi:N-acetyltransferase family protein [Aquibacillus halophilus]|uniref:GNAT family N-acetyltransferase n=1 Tax=Aquibacillus halophilus TaxID=930132 RepID=UPI0030B83978